MTPVFVAVSFSQKDASVHCFHVLMIMALQKMWKLNMRKFHEELALLEGHNFHDSWWWVQLTSIFSESFFHFIIRRFWILSFVINFYESVEEKLEVGWKEEGHNCSAQLHQVSFNYTGVRVNRKIHLEINQTNKAASKFSLARCFRLSYLFLQGSIIDHS